MLNSLRNIRVLLLNIELMSARKLTRRIRSDKTIGEINTNVSLNANNNRIRIVYDTVQTLEISYQDGMIFSDFDSYVRKRFGIAESTIISYKNEMGEGNVLAILDSKKTISM